MLGTTKLLLLAAALRRARFDTVEAKEEFEAARVAMDVARKKLNEAYAAENKAHAELVNFIAGAEYWGTEKSEQDA